MNVILICSGTCQVYRLEFTDSHERIHGIRHIGQRRRCLDNRASGTACAWCFSAKKKCDGSRPCGTCRSSGRECRERSPQLQGTLSQVPDTITDFVKGQTNGRLDYQLAEPNHSNQKIDFSFDKSLSVIYSLDSPVLTNLCHVPINDRPDPRISSYRMAVMSLSLWVAPEGKKKSVEYRRNSSRMLESANSTNSLLACVTYILLV